MIQYQFKIVKVVRALLKYFKSFKKFFLNCFLYSQSTFVQTQNFLLIHQFYVPQIFKNLLNLILIFDSFLFKIL